MSSSFRFCLAAITLAIIALVTPHHAAADSYQITVVDHTQSQNFLGIDDQGNFIYNAEGILCGGTSFSPCFGVFLIGQSPFFTTTPPTLDFDNGTPCTIALNSGFDGQTKANGTCNNGHEMFSVSIPRGVYDGPDVSDRILVGSFDAGFVNANGDAVFIDGLDNELIFARDLTTAAAPEPSTLLLLGTGCLSLLGTLRRFTRSK